MMNCVTKVKAPFLAFTDLERQLRPFRHHTLEDLGADHLMTRVDTKYLLPISQLATMLNQLKPIASVLSVDEHLLTEYRSTYFDNSKRQFYLNHHNGHRQRVKVRTRTYVTQGSTFLELKKKDSKSRTQKLRVPYRDYSGEKEREFLLTNEVFNAAELLPTQDCSYWRIALADAHFKERLTLDLNVHFADRICGKSVDLDGLVVVEVKQAKFNIHSEFMRVIRQLKLQPVKFSKYCIGTRLTCPDGVKTNQFKQATRLIKKLTGDVHYA